MKKSTFCITSSYDFHDADSFLHVQYNALFLFYLRCMRVGTLVKIDSKIPDIRPLLHLVNSEYHKIVNSKFYLLVREMKETLTK